LAQPQTLQRVAFLSYGCPIESERPDWIAKFRQYLAELGHVEGINMVIDVRTASAATGLVPSLVAELMALRPDVMVVNSYEGTKAIQRLNVPIPIVFSGGGDPVAAGFVDSLARPGHNLTGVAFAALDTTGKRLELLRKVVPRAVRLGVLAERGDADYIETSLAPKARALGFTIVSATISSQEDFSRALTSLREARVEALMTTGGAFFFCKRRQVAAMSRALRAASIFDLYEEAEAGGLLSYGPDVLAITRLVARQVDRILRGRAPADIPVEQPNEYELVVNAGVAKSLGIQIPAEIALRAQRIIE
jgi:putative ABC transport system substrate-binding protein